MHEFTRGRESRMLSKALLVFRLHVGDLFAPGGVEKRVGWVKFVNKQEEDFFFFFFKD